MWYDILPLLLKMSITAGITIILVLAARLALKRAPRIFSYLLWFIVLFRLICPVSFKSEYSALGVLEERARTAYAKVSDITGTKMPDMADTRVSNITDNYMAFTGNYDGGSNDSDASGFNNKGKQVNYRTVGNSGADVRGADDDAAGEIGYMTVQKHGVKESEQGIIKSIFAVGTIIWLAGVIAAAGAGAVSYGRLKQRIAASVRLHDNIYISDYIMSPFVAGFIKPRIYIPSGLCSAERHYVILHEKYHARRLDYIAKPLFFAAVCVHWFNPLAWLSFRFFVNDMEMSCDEGVMRKLDIDARSKYAALLLKLSAEGSTIKGMPPAFGEGEVKMRIKNIINWKKPRIAVVILSALICVMFASCMAADPQTAEPSVNTVSDTDNKDNKNANNEQDAAKGGDKNPVSDVKVIEYLEKWAEATVSKDRDTLLSMAEGEAHDTMKTIIMPKKPWPDAVGGRAYDIVYADNGSACILYYGKDSGHLTVIVEILKYENQSGEYKIVKENIKFLDSIDNADDFNIAYSHISNKNQDGSFSFAGTMLDYESQGFEDVFALDSTWRYHTPVDSVRYLLNLSGDASEVKIEQSGDTFTYVKEGREYTAANVLVEFVGDDKTKGSASNRVLVTAKMLNSGVWLPELYKTGLDTFKYNATFGGQYKYSEEKEELAKEKDAVRMSEEVKRMQEFIYEMEKEMEVKQREQ